MYSNSGDTPSIQLLIFAVMILITFFYLGERYWTALSYFPSLVLVKSLYCDIIVVIKCTRCCNAALLTDRPYGKQTIIYVKCCADWFVYLSVFLFIVSV